MAGTPQDSSKETRLDSWKAIAAFFGRDERTVRRWERERGLPVRRVPGAARGTVFAYAGELERWLAGDQEIAPVASASQESAVAKESPGDEVHEAPAIQSVLQTTNWRRGMLWAFPVLLMVAFLVYSSSGNAPVRLRKAFAAHHEPNSTAQDLYLKGRFYFEKRTPEDLNTAVDAFTQAIVRDASYAQAYVGLADSYSLLREFSTMTPYEAEQRAKAAAEKAVDLDPNLAEAHTSLAFAEFWGFLDSADADREFRRGIELDPNVARAHHWYATFLTAVLRPLDALDEIERARKLDPSSKAILADKGAILIRAGRLEEARSLLKQLEVADPGFRSSHQYLGLLYWDEGDYGAALEEFQKEASLRGEPSDVNGFNAQQDAFRKSGLPGLLEYRLHSAMQNYASGKGSAYAAARAHGDLHHRDETIKFLELSRDRHESELADVEVEPAFRFLHTDMEFRNMVVKFGMPPLPR